MNDYIHDAIELVSAWPDLPDTEFAQAVNAQARLMAGLHSDYLSIDADPTAGYIPSTEYAAALSF
jgi:hypothetical protein